jgi:hypothetical protein
VGLGDRTLLKGQEFRQDPIFDDGLIEVGWGRVYGMLAL